jgi:hypothetical protein
MLSGASAVQVALENERPLVLNEQAVKAGNVCGGPADRIKSNLLWRGEARQSKCEE